MFKRCIASHLHSIITLKRENTGVFGVHILHVLLNYVMPEFM